MSSPLIEAKGTENAHHQTMRPQPLAASDSESIDFPGMKAIMGCLLVTWGIMPRFLAGYRSGKTKLVEQCSGVAMWKHKQDDEFDVTVWRGPLDLTKATVRLGMMAGLGLLWLGLVTWVFYGA